MLIQTVEDLQAFVDSHSDDTATNESHVYQIWEDGELTIQKAGPLLWARNLHMLSFPLPGVDLTLPHRTSKHRYATLRFKVEDENSVFQRELADLRSRLCRDKR